MTQPAHGPDDEPRSRRRHPRWWPSPAGVPFLAVLLVVLVGFVRIMGYHWRQGSTLIGVALLLAAVLRAVLGPDRVGLIAIRSKALDVLAYATFGVLVIAVALTIE